jgi:hypothetical protein
VDVKEFQNAKNLVLSIHLIGETPEQQTRLFERNILSKDEFPLDLNVALKVSITLIRPKPRTFYIYISALFHARRLESGQFGGVMKSSNLQ